MADNIVLSLGTQDGATVATRNIDGIDYVIQMLSFGTTPTLVSTSAGLPVAQQGDWNIATVTTLTDITNPVAVTGTFWQATQPVSAAALPLPTGAASETTLGTVADNTYDTNYTLALLNNKVTACDTGAVVLTTGTASIGNVGLAPQTNGGLLISRVISAATTNATLVKNAAGQVFGWYVTNTNAAVAYLKLYNKASAPTVGTDTPVMTIAIPGNAAGAGCTVEFANGITFATGIGVGLTTGVADNDTGAVGAGKIVVNLLYK